MAKSSVAKLAAAVEEVTAAAAARDRSADRVSVLRDVEEGAEWESTGRGVAEGAAWAVTPSKSMRGRF